MSEAGQPDEAEAAEAAASEVKIDSAAETLAAARADAGDQTDETGPANEAGPANETYPLAEVEVGDVIDVDDDNAVVQAGDRLVAERVLVSESMLVQIIEAALLVAPEPLTIDRLQLLFGDDAPSRDELQTAINQVGERCMDMSYELVKVASGYRFQVRQHLAPWVGRLYAERPAKYSRALLETLALVAYRQPVTRGDIEDVRGVAVSTGIMRTLLERSWIHVVGYREVPGRPALYGTTKAFLDYFSLSSLEDLPPLSEVRDLDQVGRDLELALGLDTGSADSQLIDGGMSALGDDTALVPAVALSSAHQDADSVASSSDEAPDEAPDEGTDEAKTADIAEFAVEQPEARSATDSQVDPETSADDARRPSETE